MAPSIFVDITGSANGLNKAFGQAGSGARKFGSSMKTAAKTAGIALAAGVAAAGYAMKKSVSAALEAEKAQTRLDSAFKASNASAKDRAAAMLQVSRTSSRAALDDEDLADSLARLIRVTGDTTKATQGMAVAADLARARGISLEQATQIVTKAQLGNLGALKRIGIEIPKVTAAQDALKESGKKATDEQIRAAKAADDLATRQQAIASLQEQYAGSAEKYGQTASGAMERFKVEVENLQESLGARLLPAVAKVAGGAADFINKFSEARSAGDKFRVVTDTIKTSAEQAFKAVSDAVRKVNWPEVIRQMQDGMTKAAKAGYDALKTGLQQVNWGEVGRIIGQNVTRSLKTVTNALNSVDWNQAGNAMMKRLGAFLSGINWWDVYRGFLNGLLAINKAIAGVMVGAGVAIGQALIKGIVSGLDSLRGWISAKVAELAGMIPGWMRGMLGIKSPSTVMAKLVGQPIIQGIVSGMEAEQLKLAAVSSKIADSAKQAFVDKVKEAQQDIKDAFASWGDAAIAAYDDNWDRLQKRIQDKRTKSSLSGDVAAAKKDLADAKLGLKVSGILQDGESLEDWSARNKEARDRVTAAQKTLDDALQAQRDFAAQQKHEKDRARFVQDVAQLQADGIVLVQKHGENHTAILKKIKGFEGKYKLHGKGLGDALADGIRDAAGNVRDAVNELAALIAKGLNMRAAVTTATSKVTGKAKGGPVSAGTPYVVGEKGPELFVPNASGTIIPNGGSAPVRSGGGTTVINFSFPNYVGSKDDLIDAVHTGLLQKQRRVGSLGIV